MYQSHFIKYKQFATAIFDATVHFNIGNLATLYDKLDIGRGYYTTKGCIDDNCVRIITMLVEKVVMNINDAGNL